MKKVKYISPLVTSVRRIETHSMLLEASIAGDNPGFEGGEEGPQFVKEKVGFDENVFNENPWTY